MILQLQQNQDSLRKEADEARAAARFAKQKLADTEKKLEAAQEELERIAVTSPPDAVKVPSDEKSGFTFAVEALYLQPSADNLVYAIVDPFDGPVPGKVGGNIEPGLGSRTQSVDPDMEPGIRAEIGYKGAAGTDVAFRFSYFNADTTESVTEPAGGEIVTPYNPARVVPGFVEDADRAEGTFELDYHAFDVEVGQSLQLGSRAEVRLFGGLRYGSIDPTLRARYFGDDFTVANGGPGELTIKSEFSGIGPRLGGRLGWNFANGLTLFGGVAGSVLVGDLETQYRFNMPNDPAATDRNREVTDEAEHQFVPVLEANAGVRWTHDSRMWSLNATAGYQFEQWFDAQGFLQLPSGVTNAGGINGASGDDSNLVETRGDVMFHGPFLNLQVRF